MSEDTKKQIMEDAGLPQVAVVDTETTGIEDKDQVVELACVIWPTGAHWSTYVCPTVPVTLEARAVHHITDEELESAPTMAEVRHDYSGDIGDDLMRRVQADFRNLRKVDGMACHNQEFDDRLMRQSGVLPEELPPHRICTWRCSLHLYPDSPSHSNQVLRYYLGLDPETYGLPPHRALADCGTTAAILNRMVMDLIAQGLTAAQAVARLEELTKQPTILARVPFGKSRGRPWSEMDRGFLEWVLNPRQQFGEDIKHTARHWIEQMRQAHPLRAGG